MKKVFKGACISGEGDINIWRKALYTQVEKKRGVTTWRWRKWEQFKRYKNNLYTSIITRDCRQLAALLSEMLQHRGSEGQKHTWIDKNKN